MTAAVAVSAATAQIVVIVMDLGATVVIAVTAPVVTSTANKEFIDNGTPIFPPS